MTDVGPGKDDSYSDVRSDYEKNEVAVDYNSGFTGEVGHTSKLASTLFFAVPVKRIGNCLKVILCNARLLRYSSRG